MEIRNGKNCFIFKIVSISFAEVIWFDKSAFWCISFLKAHIILKHEGDTNVKILSENNSDTSQSNP